MKGASRNMLVLFGNEGKTEQKIKLEFEYLNEILRPVFSIEHFCLTHELVNRNYITSKKSHIFSELKYSTRRPFRFFVNKN